MPYKHPYTLGSGPLTQMIKQLRKSFPPVVNADTLKKLGIAANNESYVINTLKFIGVIDDEGNKVKLAGAVFSKHDNSEFAQEFGTLVRTKYQELFDLNGEESWTLEQDKLIAFFRSTDESSAEVGRRQASTFQTLAGLSGHVELPKTKSHTATKSTVKPEKGNASKLAKRVKAKEVVPPPGSASTKDAPIEKPSRHIGLTVRIEINLPAVADQATYDMIFKSIRENLIDAE
jgi:Family of unknown function (DUF5343)